MTQLQYITCSGSQYISGITLPESFRAVFVMALDATTACYNIYDTHSASPMLWVTDSGMLELDASSSSRSDVSKGTKITVTVDATGASEVMSVDGSTVFTKSKISGSHGVTLLNRGGGQCFKGKIYEIRIYNGASLAYDLVPALNDSSVACLYDTVSGTYYANIGSGSFAAGPVASHDRYYLVRSGSVLYSTASGSLVQLSETSITASLFTSRGATSIPSGSLLITLDNPEVIEWASDASLLKGLTADITGSGMSPQTLTINVDVSDSTITGISGITADYAGNISVRYSTDGGTTYTSVDTIANFLSVDKGALWTSLQTTKRLIVILSLSDADAIFKQLKIAFTNTN